MRQAFTIEDERDMVLFIQSSKRDPTKKKTWEEAFKEGCVTHPPESAYRHWRKVICPQMKRHSFRKKVLGNGDSSIFIPDSVKDDAVLKLENLDLRIVLFAREAERVFGIPIESGVSLLSCGGGRTAISWRALENMSDEEIQSLSNNNEQLGYTRFLEEFSRQVSILEV